MDNYIFRVQMLMLFCFISVCAIAQKTAQTLAPTPPMGFITWNLFEGNISEDMVKSIADAMVETGMKDAGYEYVIIDDLWQGDRDENGVLHPDYSKFPNGMKALADYVHSKGLKFGIYTDIAPLTCAGEEGSYGYEAIDAQTFAEWGVDYIKCDYCYAPKDIFTAVERYGKFIKEVRKQDKKMVFALCEWGKRSPWLWGESIDAQLWRTTWDLRDTWEHGSYGVRNNGIMECLDIQAHLHEYAKPGHWNDMDMLVVGLYGKGKATSANGAIGCTDTEYEAHMGLWSLLASTLFVTCDIREMNAETQRILMNKEIIAVNQDPLGRQAKRIFKSGVQEFWAKPLKDGGYAIGFLNRDDHDTLEMTLDLSKLKLSQVKARDLWTHTDLGMYQGEISLSVKPHECRVIRIK
ncbi:glycoside hydrolase family 27 protein [Reichenbachiella carrageenanivorans]|uniref:Alpha-galactosidase n=1 Tax=Reichenbachiella carrageenanivorans TaxID=2979869 RepID=A0ABY6D4B4_9BACT|nr:glycoside hydrolase family 27 protein [Reichenbachiella carrageenanivorans]UXX80981.1 glycoside hydrolase family 27 protein [Reichenbachiella carrageenanivorans]